MANTTIYKTSQATSEDKMYERQICDTNKLGNALLCGLVVDGICENKKAIKICGNLKILKELIESYQSEINKLRSLQIGPCSDILEAKENSSYQVQISAAEQLLKKIESILKSHVRHNAANVISKEELVMLQDQTKKLASVQSKLEKIPPTSDDMKNHLLKVRGVRQSLEQITSSLDVTQSKVGVFQKEIVTEAADVVYFSS